MPSLLEVYLKITVLQQSNNNCCPLHQKIKPQLQFYFTFYYQSDEKKQKERGLRWIIPDN
jgi:hypothetical protein